MTKTIRRAHKRNLDGIPSNLYKNPKADVDLILKEARINNPLREEIIKLKKALDRGDRQEAAELSGVKSLISGELRNMDVSIAGKETEYGTIKDKYGNETYIYQEDTDYNQKKLGRAVYSILDYWHHELSWGVGRIPRGMMIFTSKGIVKG